MRVYRAYWDLPRAALGAVVAIGNFDGVHRGHRALIDAARQRARALAAPLGVITFEPHPREVLAPDKAPPRITPLRPKALILATLGVEQLFALPFTRHLREKSPEAFVHDVLAGGLGVRHVVVGYDFRFGYQASGDVTTLRRLGEDYGFGVTCIEPVSWRGKICSSSRVRDAIAAGDVALAHDLLGHPFVVEGRVVRGDQRGRGLGYPTANVHLPRKRVLLPAPGVYAVRAGRREGERAAWYQGAANLGFKPTFGAHPLGLEIYLLDQDLNLYGERLCCAFIERLRAEEAFASADELKAAMARDCERAREILAAIPA